jgi:hypothetical protein
VLRERRGDVDGARTQRERALKLAAKPGLADESVIRERLAALPAAQ